MLSLVAFLVVSVKVRHLGQVERLPQKGLEEQEQEVALEVLLHPSMEAVEAEVVVVEAFRDELLPEGQFTIGEGSPCQIGNVEFDRQHHPCYTKSTTRIPFLTIPQRRYTMNSLYNQALKQSNSLRKDLDAFEAEISSATSSSSTAPTSPTVSSSATALQGVHSSLFTNFLQVKSK